MAVASVYVSQLLSSWGDRSWNFAAGLLLVNLAPENLRLTALFGLVLSTSVIVFGASIGKWVDKTNRLTAGRVALIVQNLSVAASAGIFALLLFRRDEANQLWNGWGLTVGEVVVVVTGSIANLASVAFKISIQKDWIVVIANNDDDALAKMNSVCRSLDLTSYTLAPIFVGAIMGMVSPAVGAIVIAGWNLASVFVEYTLLWVTFRRYPALAESKSVTATDHDIDDHHLHEDIHTHTTQDTVPVISNDSVPELPSPTDDAETKSVTKKNVNGGLENPAFVATEDHYHTNMPTLEEDKKLVDKNPWRQYWQNDVRWAGFGLACLFMTVLGFDNITVAFATMQGVPEPILGGVAAVGAIIGLMGSLSFPKIRSMVGLERTGLFGFGLEVLCLMLCVLSIWAPGSPFSPDSSSVQSAFSLFEAVNETTTVPPAVTEATNYTSVSMLLSGIALARFGLWLADLTVNQILQENVALWQRGSINGVQNSINMAMDVLKFVLVVALPAPEMFGILILLSFLFVCGGWLSYAMYSRHKRGHVLPHFGQCNNVGAYTVSF